VRATDTADTIRIGGISVRFLLEGPESDGGVAMFEFGVASGAQVPGAHSHDGYEETVYGLEGTLLFTVEGVEHPIGPGDVLCIRRGEVHSFANRSDADTRALAVVTPGILGPAYFREVAAVLDAAAGGPPDGAAIGEVMRRHGLTPAG
jgi:quercetin dioxygenase-like cupin family protein